MVVSMVDNGPIDRIEGFFASDADIDAAGCDGW